ncbi:MAG: TIGR00341 family protein [Candidatus Heimdallarchaeota archaeon]|nr:TIGR00341 family protein [Candidatus Heimdallarchaeota archaeon]
MRQIQVTVPAGEGEDITKRLVELVSPSQISLIKGNDADLILVTTFPTRTDIIIDLLDELGIGRVKGRMTILPIEATVPKLRSRKKDKFLRRISLSELEQTIDPLTNLDFNYIAFTLLCSILAAMGLINNDTITILASMIISPTMGPIIGAAFGAVVWDKRILKRSMIAEGLGIVLSIIVGILVGLIFPPEEIPEFVIARGEAHLITLIIAIATGLTAGICFVSRFSTELVGVAAAAALLPVTVNIGLAIGMGAWSIAVGSLVIFIVNVACVHLGCMIIFWLRDVEPPQVVKKVKAKRSLRAQIIAILLILAVVTLPIVQTSIQIFRRLQYQRLTNEVVEESLYPIDGVIEPAEIDVTITGGLFRAYDVKIDLRVMSSKLLPTDTETMIKEAIESRVGHEVSVTLLVILSQNFEQESFSLLAPSERMCEKNLLTTLKRKQMVGRLVPL